MRIVAFNDRFFHSFRYYVKKFLNDEKNDGESAGLSEYPRNLTVPSICRRFLILSQIR